MQTEELDKCKAWGSLQTTTMEAALTSPQTKKAKPNTTVDLTHSLDLIVVLETDDIVSTNMSQMAFWILVMMKQSNR
jgi:hypothetical protein